MNHVIIERSKWLRGKGPSQSCLLAPPDNVYAGKMCCIGFVALAGGLKKENILGWQSLNQLENLPPVLEAMRTDFLARAYEANDQKWYGAGAAGPAWLISKKICNAPTAEIAELERETIITQLLKEMGWTVEFVD